jgi:hypothetical protein
MALGVVFGISVKYPFLRAKNIWFAFLRDVLLVMLRRICCLTRAWKLQRQISRRSVLTQRVRKELSFHRLGFSSSTYHIGHWVSHLEFCTIPRVLWRLWLVLQPFSSQDSMQVTVLRCFSRRTLVTIEGARLLGMSHSVLDG